MRGALLETFAHHDSKAVQHTLYAMGEAVLAHCAEVEEISITMPHKHHLLVDLVPMGLDTPYEIFVPTSEPCGLMGPRCVGMQAVRRCCVSDAGFTRA